MNIIKSKKAQETARKIFDPVVVAIIYIILFIILIGILVFTFKRFW